MRKEFTLVELLVVAAMIAVLTAMLLPALAAARGSARGSACFGNLRQMSVAFSVYASDSDDCHPKVYICEYGFYWSNILQSIVSGKPLYADGVCSCAIKHQRMNNYLGFCSSGMPLERGTVFHCPSQKMSPCCGLHPDPISYSMNVFLGGTDYSGNSLTSPWVRASRVQYPSACLLVTESGYLMTGKYYWWDYWTVPLDYHGANGGIHNYGSNVLYEDGHCNWMHRLKFPAGTSSIDQRRFWYGTD